MIFALIHLQAATDACLVNGENEARDTVTPILTAHEDASADTLGCRCKS
jgi:hypothetical protein